jgi:hypothetical protein
MYTVHIMYICMIHINACIFLLYYYNVCTYIHYILYDTIKVYSQWRRNSRNFHVKIEIALIFVIYVKVTWISTSLWIHLYSMYNTICSFFHYIVLYYIYCNLHTYVVYHIFYVIIILCWSVPCLCNKSIM